MQSGRAIRYGAVQYVLTHDRDGPQARLSLSCPPSQGCHHPRLPPPMKGHKSFAGQPGSEVWVFFDPVHQSPPFRGPMVLARLPRFGWSVDAWIC